MSDELPPVKYSRKRQVNTDAADRRVWMVKVPKKVADTWRLTPNSNANILPENTPLGQLSIATSANGDKEVTISLENGQVKPEVGMLKFQLKQQKDQPPTRVFSENAEGNVVFEGKVDSHCVMQPIFDKSYRRITNMSNQRIKDLKNQKQTSLYDDKKDYQQSSFTNINTGNKRPRTEISAYHDRRERMDKDPLVDLLLRLFGEKEQWGLKELQDRTNQPEAWLKSVLLTLADAQKQPGNKTMYVLNDTYSKLAS